MTTRAVIILATGIALLFVSVLFPPWVVFSRGPSSVTELPYGYSFLFTTPEPESLNVSIRVDFPALFLEWLLVVACVTVALWLERKKTMKQQPDEESGDQK